MLDKVNHVQPAEEPGSCWQARCGGLQAGRAVLKDHKVNDTLVDTSKLFAPSISNDPTQSRAERSGAARS